MVDETELSASECRHEYFRFRLWTRTVAAL